ncbi:WcaA Glycosyltransferases involved in cell wall biogenesis [Candidatus Planktophila dulcis]
MEYVEVCFAALLELENRGAAVIVVDDGSTDGSSELLLSLRAKANSKIQIIKTLNQGAGPARRLSIEIAQTDFVFFLDIDDLPFTTAVQELLLAFKSVRADIAIGNYQVMQKSGSSLMPVSLPEFGQVSLRDYRNEFKEAMGWWRYIYKRDFLLQPHNMIGSAFEEFGTKKFVLDDLFWMIHLSSQNLDVLVSPTSLSIYHYNLPAENADERWNSYLKQVSFLPEAASKFLNFIEINNCDHNVLWMRETTLTDVWNHMPLLPFFTFHDSYFASFKLTSEVLGKNLAGYLRASKYLCVAVLKRAVRISRNL